MSKIKKNAAIFLKGFCMGIADIIPGVSGGTIAFLMGIYEELLESISSFNAEFVGLFLTGKIQQAFTKTAWRFLLVLVTGILTAIFLLSHLLKWLMVNHTVYIYAFFLGIVLTTVFIIMRKIKKWDGLKIFAGLISAITMFFLVGMVPIQTPETWWFLFLSGAIAICAMILPGISGAFILLLLGKYEYIITAVTEKNIGILVMVAAGCVVGLLTFVRILRWLLRHYYDTTLSILAGLVLGSLRRIWPWRETVSTMVTAHGRIVPLKQLNIFPDAITLEVVWAAIFCLAGMCLSVWLASFDTERTSD